MTERTPPTAEPPRWKDGHEVELTGASEQTVVAVAIARHRDHFNPVVTSAEMGLALAIVAALRSAALPETPQTPANIDVSGDRMAGMDKQKTDEQILLTGTIAKYTAVLDATLDGPCPDCAGGGENPFAPGDCPACGGRGFAVITVQRDEMELLLDAVSVLTFELGQADAVLRGERTL